MTLAPGQNSTEATPSENGNPVSAEGVSNLAGNYEYGEEAWTPDTGTDEASSTETAPSKKFWTRGRVVAAIATGAVLGVGGTAGIVALGDHPTHSATSDPSTPSANPTEVPTPSPSETTPADTNTNIVVAGKTPEQLKALFVIPDSVDIKDVPAAYIDKLVMAENGGADTTDIPTGNRQPDDPIFAEVANMVDTAANAGLYGGGNTLYMQNAPTQHKVTLYYYNKTVFEQQIYTNTEPFRGNIVISGTSTIQDIGNGTYDIKIPVTLSDNALKNSVQQQEGAQAGQTTNRTEHIEAYKTNGQWLFKAYPDN